MAPVTQAHGEGCRSQLWALPCCENTNNKECSRYYIHKFRTTYTTRLLRSDMDPGTVMSFTGHEDLETVLRYLAPAGAEENQVTVSPIRWA